MADYRFGPFRLDPDLGVLMRGDRPSALGRRAVLLLQLLLKRRGEPVSKDALIGAAWTGLTVEDSNLTVQISALRRALDEAGGRGWIETLPRRGYRYVGPDVELVARPLRTEDPAPPALPDKPSVAVLPFRDSGEDPDRTHLADGMMDDIIAGLSRISWLFVIGRGSTFAYRPPDVDPKRVGRDLGVRYLLQGSVRTSSGRVRIGVQLVEAQSGAPVWTERYDRELGEVFALQDEIAAAVVGALQPGLRRAEVERLKRRRTDSLDAYELVLRAQPDIDSGMPDQIARALPLLERSIALDPSYALAHASAAMCHHCLFLRGGLTDHHLAASLRHAEAALRLGNNDALALTLAGFSIGMDGHDRPAAFAAFEAALAVSPSSALTYLLGSVILGWAGDADRAIDWAGRGLRLSPFDPWSFAALHALVLGHFKRERYEDAAAAGYRAVLANPSHSISHMLLAASLVRLGREAEAIAAASKVLKLQPNFRSSLQLAGVDCEPALAESLGSALDEAGLPR